MNTLPCFYGFFFQTERNFYDPLFTSLGLFLTHYMLVDSSTVICWTGPFFLGLSGLFCFNSIFIENLVANNADPD